MPDELYPIIVDDNLELLTPPVEIAITVGLGATGERGSVFYAGNIDPASYFLINNIVPKEGDIYILLNTESRTVYQAVRLPENIIWNKIFSIEDFSSLTIADIADLQSKLDEIDSSKANALTIADIANLQNILDEIDYSKANVSHTHSDKADVSHTHSDKADVSHTHENLVSITYANETFATKESMNAIESSVGLLAPINSPSFTGVPVAPTANIGTNTTQVATTKFVNNQINEFTNNVANNTQIVLGSQVFN